MSITYNDNVPLSSNNPSNDQPEMLINTQSIQSIWAVDHITFDSGAGLNSGQHKFVNFNGTNTPTTPTPPNSALYTIPGIASTNADMRFINTNNGIIFPVNLIRAYGVFDTTGAILNNQAINLTVNLGTNPWTAGAGYTIFITANAVTLASASFGVLLTANSPSLSPLWAAGYTISSATQMQIGFRNVANNAFGQPSGGFTCIVYQL